MCDLANGVVALVCDEEGAVDAREGRDAVGLVEPGVGALAVLETLGAVEGACEVEELTRGEDGVEGVAVGGDVDVVVLDEHAVDLAEVLAYDAVDERGLCDFDVGGDGGGDGKDDGVGG